MRIAIALLIVCLGVIPAAAQRIGSGDTLNVKVLQDPKLDGTVLVDSGGEIVVPLAGHIRARGLTTQAVESIIKERLKDKFRDGQVDVTVAFATEAGPRGPLEEDLKPKVFLTGEVVKPGSYVVRQRTTLVQAIALAGGLSPFAAKSRIQVRRRMPSGEVIYPFDYRAYESGVYVDSDIVLRTGDVVLVPERGFFE